MEREYPPLSSNCVKNLVDKLFEKRKLAAAEIERIAKESFLNNRRTDVVQLIGYFSQDFILSPNPHTRKGGLLGLASVAIGLNQHAYIYHEPIIIPVIQTFHDNDPRVRYYACETLYNVMKMTRKETLSLLAEVFDAISRSIADSDLLVRQGALQCDRLLKEIVTEPDTVDPSRIISLLRERIYTNNPFARQFIVSWITALFSVPGLKLTVYLPQLLDGLFRILGDPNPDICRQCEILLSDLLSEIRMNPRGVAFNAMINILIVHCHMSLKVSNTAKDVPTGSLLHADLSQSGPAIVMNASSQSASLLQHSAPHHQATVTSASTTGSNTTIMASSNSLQTTNILGSSGENLRRRTALIWIRAFVELDEPVHLLSFTSGILNAVLPCFLMHDTLLNTKDDWRVVLQTAAAINETLLKAINDLPAVVPTGDVGCESLLSSNGSVDAQLADPLGGTKTTGADSQSRTDFISTDAILDVTCKLLDHQSLLTRLAAFHWIEVLGRVRRNYLLRHIGQLLPLMLSLMSDPADEMVHAAIRLVGNLCDKANNTQLSDLNGIGNWTLDLPEVLTEILGPKVEDLPARLSHLDGSFGFVSLRFLHDLVRLFDRDTRLLALRGDMIISDLCYVLGAEPVYRILSTIITHSADLKSASVLVQSLNRILLTQPQLHEFRNELRAIRTRDGCLLLEGLYRAWCHNPVALLSLCLLTQNYQQCSRLIKSLAEVTITVDTLVDMDQLIQMIESPIFATLRLHLLDKRFTADLRETLYCLLMCLPQSDAFQTLWQRLQCLPATDHISDWQVVSHRPQPDFKLINQHVSFDALFDHFHIVQKRQQLHQQSLSPSSATSPTLSLLTNQIQQLNMNTNSNRESEEASHRRVQSSACKNAAVTSPMASSTVRSTNPTATATKIVPSVFVGSAADFLAESLATVGIHIPSLHSTIGVPPL